MYDIDDPQIVSIMLESKDNDWTRRKVVTELEDLERFSEQEIDEILEWYRGYYRLS